MPLTEAMLEFESLAEPFWCEENTVLLTEGKNPAEHYSYLREGQNYR